MGSKKITGLTILCLVTIGIITCSSNETATGVNSSRDTINLSSRFPLSTTGKLIVEKKGDTLIYYYPRQIIIKQSLNTDSVLIVIWDQQHKYEFLVDRSLEFPGQAGKIKIYYGGIENVYYWKDQYGLVAENTNGYPNFYDRGNPEAEMAITALISDATGFFTMLLPEEDTVNIAKIDSIRRKSK